MTKSKQYIIFIAIFLLTISSMKRSYSQSKDDLRAMYIFNIAAGTTWENENDISKFTIGVFSSEEAYVALERLAEKRLIKKKPFEIIKYTDYKDVKPNHVVYVTKNENANLGFVYKELKGKNVLIISDRCHEPQYSAVNLRKQGDSRPFDINSNFAKVQNIKFSTTMLRLGGSRTDIRKMQIETNKKLEQVQIELKDKETENKELKNTIKNLNILLKEQEKRLQVLENKSN